MKLYRSCLVGAALALASGVAVAEKTSFQLQQGVLQWHSSDSKVKAGSSDAVTTKSDGIDTMPNSLELSMNYHGMTFYVYPTASDAPLAAGYYVMPNLEVGLKLAVDNTKVGSAQNDKSNTFGLYGIYYQELAASSSLEFTLAGSTTMGTSKATSTESHSTKSTGTDFGLSIAYQHKLSDNLFYLGGLSYDMSSDKETDKLANPSVTTTTTATSVGVNLLTLRYVVD